MDNKDQETSQEKKFETRISKYETNTNTEVRNSKRYDLEDRTLRFAAATIDYCRSLPSTAANFEIKRQLIHSSGSVGANYIEANESLSKKDFLLRIKICRKEAKESRYWLRLTESPKPSIQSVLIQEATELMNIFAAILRKSL